jgi:hypothetical protein
MATVLNNGLQEKSPRTNIQQCNEQTASLPNEIIYMIINMLARLSDFNNLTSTCWNFKKIAHQCIFRNDDNEKRSMNLFKYWATQIRGELLQFGVSCGMRLDSHSFFVRGKFDKFLRFEMEKIFCKKIKWYVNKVCAYVGEHLKIPLHSVAFLHYSRSGYQILEKTLKRVLNKELMLEDVSNGNVLKSIFNLFFNKEDGKSMFPILKDTYMCKALDFIATSFSEQPFTSISPQNYEKLVEGLADAFSSNDNMELRNEKSMRFGVLFHVNVLRQPIIRQPVKFLLNIESKNALETKKQKLEAELDKINNELKSIAEKESQNSSDEEAIKKLQTRRDQIVIYQSGSENVIVGGELSDVIVELNNICNDLKLAADDISDLNQLKETAKFYVDNYIDCYHRARPKE